LISSQIERLLERSRVPGCSMAVLHDGVVDFVGTFGQRSAASGQPVTPETVFQAASLGKPLLAYIALQLVDEDLLDLDAPLHHQVPASRRPNVAGADAVSARMLLSHTSGLPNWRRRGQQLRLQWTPGERFGYSGEGYLYLQSAIEHLTGQSLQALAHNRLFEPLGLRRTSYVWQPALERDAAVGHNADRRPRAPSRPSRPAGSYSLLTTAGEYAGLTASLWLPATGASTTQGQRVADRMLTPSVWLNNGIAWGLGWGLQITDGDTVIWHWGDNPGFKSFVAASRRLGSGVVIMTNGERGLALCREVVESTTPLGPDVFGWLAAFYGVAAIT